MTAISHKAAALVHAEGVRALEKHPIFPGHDPSRALRILVEEVGEVAKAIDPKHPEGTEALMRELAQIGATCARWMEYLIQSQEKKRSKY